MRTLMLRPVRLAGGIRTLDPQFGITALARPDRARSGDPLELMLFQLSYSKRVMKFSSSDRQGMLEGV